MPATGPQVVCDELVDLVATCLAHHWKKGQIKKLIYEVAGRRVARGTVETLLTKARAVLMKDANLEEDEERAKAVAFYKSIVADDTVPVKEQMDAQKALREMLRLDRGDRGGSTIERARAIRDMMHKMERSTDSASDEAD